ncbi:ATP-binding response regulator, partial [Bacteroides heparinolyticus]|uniref:ATP-binding response regulator n=3 Tax=Bacteroidales TaxID=171549 RepID=UPI0035A0C6FC
MGELLNHRGAHAEAVQNFRQAAEVFAAQHDMYNESRARMGLYKAMKDGNPFEAGQHLLRYAELKDSIYHRDMEQAVSQQNVQYKTEELALRQERERAEKRVILIGGIALTATLLFVVTVLVYLGRVRRRNHLALKRLATLRENFFTNITHEFRTPLTVILGLSHDLQATDAAEVRDKARIIERQGKGLLTLINQLLDISKIQSAMGNADWKNGNIMAYLTMIEESYRDYARTRNIDLQFFLKGTVEMDFVPDYVNKVMNNLLSNAFKFTPEYGKVSVVAWREGDRLFIDVSDTGEGMDKEMLSHAFEPFFQGESETQHIGTGVGLALVKQIIDALEGTITAESTVGRGTTFHISIPIHDNIKHKMSEVAIENTPLLPKSEPELSDSEGGDDQCRLLVIEDNRDIAAYIGSQFADRYAVSYAENGKAGLEKAQELVPDLIITDLMMPGMDGL